MLQRMRSRPETTPFARPQTPAAKCLHLIRLGGPTTRPQLIEATGLSQPTITRAVTALLNAGLIRPREDLTQVHGPGRPTTPLELAPFRPVLAGAAVGTETTYIGIYDAHGRRLRHSEIPVRVVDESAGDFLEHLVAGINRILARINRPLAAVGVTTSGRVDHRGLVTAPNLGWQAVDFTSALRYHFDVPVTVTAATSAILGAETQLAPLPTDSDDTPATLAIFADDSVSAALARPGGVAQLDTLPHVTFPTPAVQPGGSTPADVRAAAASTSEKVRPDVRRTEDMLRTAPTSTEERLSTEGLMAQVAAAGHGSLTLTQVTERAGRNAHLRALLDARSRALAAVVGKLITKHRPHTVVLAGSAFTADEQAPRTFARAFHEEVGRGHDVDLRLIPGHRDIVLSIARAVALDKLLREPIAVADSAGANSAGAAAT